MKKTTIALLSIIGALTVISNFFAYKYFTTYNLLERSMELLVKCMGRLYDGGGLV